MKTIRKYFKFVEKIFNKVEETQQENIEQAAQLVAKTCEINGRFYVFGSGHSHMIAEEIYIRAGGLAFVKGILPPELMLHQMPNKSTYLERIDGYSESLLHLYKIDERDTILIISNSGRNNVPIEMALEAKKKGAKVIAMTSLDHSKHETSRHKSGKKLYEIADVVIDNCAKKGDAAYFVEGFDIPTGPTSDATGIVIANTLIVRVIDLLVSKGIKPPVFKSSNIDGSDKYNDELFNKYYGYWK